MYLSDALVKCVAGRSSAQRMAVVWRDMVCTGCRLSRWRPTGLRLVRGVVMGVGHS